MPCRRSISALAALAALSCSRWALATPTQEEVFKSIQDNVGSTADYRKFLLFLCVAGGAIILLSLFSQRRKREVVPKRVNHHGKLIKEITRGLAVRPREIKQLKTLAEHTALPDGESVHNPLTLLLCPSVLMKAVQNPRCKADRRVIQQLLRKSIAMASMAQGVSPSARRPAAAPNEKARQVAPGRPWGNSSSTR
jgi:hypothetical protein